VFGRWPLLGPSPPDVWQAVHAGTAVLISSSFAINVGAGVGDVVHLETPSGPLPLRSPG
jgi:hypothetical protein